MGSSSRAGGVIAGLMLGWVACADPKSEEPNETPTDTELSVQAFDVAEAGWGDAPLPVHFVWSIKSSTGRFTCKLDLDGDGTFDKELPGCRADTTKDALADLPTFTFSKMGEHHPRLVVVAGKREVEATTTIYANHVDFAPGVFFPEKTPGFVSASVTWSDPKTYGVLPPHVVLNFADASQVPTLKPGTVVWGSSGIGYLMKVKTATPSANLLTLEGESAEIGEAIENGFVGARDLVPSYNDMRCLDEGCKGAEFEVLSSPPPALADGPLTSGTKSLGTQRAPLTIDGKGTLGAKIKFKTTPNIEQTLFVGMKINKFLVEIGFFKLKRFTIDTAPSFKYEFNVQGSLIKNSVNLGIIPLAPIPIPPFYVVPTLVPEVRWDLKLKASASIEASLPFKASYDSSKSEDWSWSAAPNTLGQVLEDIKWGPEAAVGAQGKLEFVPKFEALVMGCGGPYVAPAMSITGELKLKTGGPTMGECDNPTGLLGCVSLKVGLAGEGGLDAPWLANAGPALGKAYKGPIKLFDVTIAEAQFWEKCLGKCDDAGVMTDATITDSTVPMDTSVEDTGSVSDTGTSDGGIDLTGIGTECFEGMLVEVPATSLYGASTMRVTNVQEVKGGITAYAAYLATPEVGDQSTKVPAKAKVFTFGDPADLSGTPGFPNPTAGRTLNRYGRSNLIAVWINDTTGQFEWMYNVTGGHYSISGGSSPTYRQFQFIYDTRATPTDIFKTYGSTTGTSWSQVTASSLDTGSGITASATRPKDCFKLPELRLTPVSADFGAIPGGGSSAESTFTVSNIGAAPTSALSFSLGGADAATFAITGGTCVSGTTTLAGSASCTVKVKMSPASTATPGLKAASLSASATFGGSATSSLGGKVTATGLAISPTPYDFGLVLGGAATADATFTVTNTSTIATTPITLALLGPDLSAFVLSGGTCVSGTTALPAGGSCTVLARFAPSGTAYYGPKSATLQASAATGGVAAAGLSGSVLAPPGLLITPTPKAFGSVTVGMSSDEHTFTLKNGFGAATTGPITISFSGMDPTEFVTTGGTCVSGTTKLLGGETCTILAKFKPTATGAKSATLHITATPGGTVWSSINGTGL